MFKLNLVIIYSSGHKKQHKSCSIIDAGQNYNCHIVYLYLKTYIVEDQTKLVIYATKKGFHIQMHFFIDCYMLIIHYNIYS